MGPRGYPTAFQPGARRLEGGGREPEPAATAFSTPQAAALGFEVPPRHAPGIVGLRTGAGMPPAAELVRRLAALKPRPVLVSERLGVIRVSPHLYNTPDDLRCLLDGLREAVRPVSRL